MTTFDAHARRLAGKDAQQIFVSAFWNRTGHYIFALWFLLLFSSFFFSSPNFSRPRLDVYHTSDYFHTWCGLVRI